MANAFVNFLTGLADGSGNLRSYQHATRLYVDGNYAFTPKAGWIYYVKININPNIKQNIQNDPTAIKEFIQWYNKYRGQVGLLAKSVDTPKFSIETETLNQYNKKKVFQKKLNYNPITITFHDDMSNMTLNFWKSYYQYYYGDSIGGTSPAPEGTGTITDYNNNRYIRSPYNTLIDQQFGLNNFQDERFINSIEIFQLHQKKFTSFTLINPLITEWQHDQLDQTQGTKLLTSRMTVAYETVVYNSDSGNVVTSSNPGFTNNHYDKTPSPLGIGGAGTRSIFGPGGLVQGASSIFGTLSNPNASGIDLLNAALQGRNLLKNASGITKAGVIEEGTSIFNNSLKNITNNSNNNGVANVEFQGNANSNPAQVNIPSGSAPSNLTVAQNKGG